MASVANSKAPGSRSGAKASTSRRRILTNTKPSRAQGLTNANSFDVTRKTVFSNKEILESILKFLEYDDLLRARLVNNFWNEIICTNPYPKPTETRQTIWPKLRLSFPKRSIRAQVQAHLMANRETEIPPLIANALDSFESLALVRKFHCPNYRFNRVDLRQEKVQLFFGSYGEYIRSLKLDNCIMSLVTFQRIVNKCPHLERFGVAGMFHCITQAESLCSSRDCVTLCSFSHLRKLVLESSYVRHKLLNLASEYKDRKHIPIQDLHPLIIHELLLSAHHLKWIRVDGFGPETILAFMETLAVNQIHTQLTHLEFYNISNGINPEVFREYARQLSHTQLRTFALTFLAGEFRHSYPAHNDAANIDSGIGEIISHHGATLEELDLTHCQVTDKIFKVTSNSLKLSKLKTLILKGTKIFRLPRASLQLMENLDMDQVEYDDEEGVFIDADETKAMVEILARERQTRLLLQEHHDFGFKIFSDWDKKCFMILGAVVLCGIGHLLVDAFGEIGKPIYILVAAFILMYVQHVRTVSNKG